MTPGERAVALALLEWHKLISARPECYPRISEYLAAAGCKRKYPAPQVDGKPYKWCGAFAAWCWIQAGLRPDLGSSWASDYRLARLYGQYGKDANIPTPQMVLTPSGTIPLRAYHADHGGPRVCVSRSKLATVTPQPGDVALVGRKAWGGHVVLVTDLLSDGSGIQTVSGNGLGYWPADYDQPLTTKKVSGVVATDYPWSSVAWLIRPAPADLDRDLVLVRR